MGLVIVVILISLGMLFLLKFVVFKPVSQEREAFTRSQLSTNTLNALLITTTDCRAEANLKLKRKPSFRRATKGKIICKLPPTITQITSILFLKLLIKKGKPIIKEIFKNIGLIAGIKNFLSE